MKVFGNKANALYDCMYNLASLFPEKVKEDNGVFRTKSLNLVMEAAMASADYVVTITEEVYNRNLIPGRGLAVLGYESFHDELGKKLPPGTTVAMTVKETRHRAYFVVLPGAKVSALNMVIYDRFKPEKDSCHIVGCCHYEQLLPIVGLVPNWQTGNISDLATAAAAFGFEMHRRDNRVIIRPGHATLKVSRRSTFDLLFQFADMVNRQQE